MKKILLFAATLFILIGCSEPLTEENLAYAGLWKSNQTSLLITNSGQLEYKTKKGSVSTSISMPIKTITENTIEAGFLFFSSTFELGGKPKQEDGMLVLVVDGEKLFKTDEQGRLPNATKIPTLDVLRPLVETELSLVSKGITKQDFSEYLKNSALLFQSQFTNEKMLQTYKPFIDGKINLTKWMDGEFVLTKEPHINGDGVLTINGKYPTSPDSLKFELSYIYSHPNWKNVGTNIEINSD